MAIEPGGRSNKLGNEYEQLWGVVQLLRVLNGEAISVLSEGLGPDQRGVDIWVKNTDGKRIGYQCKRENGIKGKWSVADLARERILENAQYQLRRGDEYFFAFVSSDPAPVISDLIERTARCENDPEKYVKYQVTTSNTHLAAFKKISKHLRFNFSDFADQAMIFNFLSRIKIIRFDKGDRAREEIKVRTQLEVEGDVRIVTPLLSDFLFDNIGIELHKDSISNYLHGCGFKLHNPIEKPLISMVIVDKKANPFGDVGRITDPDHFFDREELLRKIFEELSKGVNVSLVGESQIGKSSLLSMICFWGPERLSLGLKQLKLPSENFVYLSLQWVDDENDFYETLCKALGIENCRGGKLVHRLRGKQYVLCLDEIEKMAWDDFTVRVRSHLRGLADGPAAPLRLVIASRSPLSHLFPDSPELDSPLAGICLQLDVGSFSPEVVRSFLAHRLHGTGVTFSEYDIAELLAKSGGHPAKLQRAAALRFDHSRGMQ